MPKATLVISEIFADPALVSDAAGEFIEFVNLTPGPIALAKIQIQTPSGRLLAVTSKRKHVESGGVVVVRPSASRRPRRMNSGGSASRHVEGVATGMRLPNRAGRVALLWRGRVVDVAQWWPRWPWPKPRAGRSLSRVSPAADGRYGRSWRHETKPLRVVERASPGAHRWSCKQLRKAGVNQCPQ